MTQGVGLVQLQEWMNDENEGVNMRNGEIRNSHHLVNGRRHLGHR